jgi:hypothetical protein
MAVEEREKQLSITSHAEGMFKMCVGIFSDGQVGQDEVV